MQLQGDNLSLVTAWGVEGVTSSIGDGGNQSNGTAGAFGEPGKLHWGVLTLSLLILATAIGNVLVILAVCWESRLQNMTNYFLMSLAIADLLVSLLVMPLGMIVELFGGIFPLDAGFCVMWATMDVLLCTASIWHMCTMSMDRYFTLKYPMKYGRNKTRTMVVLKITFVWVVSIALCSPVCIMGFLDYNNVYSFEQKACAPQIRNFVIYGSIFAFYVPLTIMVVTYALTIQILCKNQKIMQTIFREQSLQVTKTRKDKNGANCDNGMYLSPSFMPRFMDRGSVDTSVSFAASVNESTLPSTTDSVEPGTNNIKMSVINANHCISEAGPGRRDEDQQCPTAAIPIVTEPPTEISAGDYEDMAMEFSNSIENFELGKDEKLVFAGLRSSLSVSQPHLPSLHRHGSTKSQNGSLAPYGSHRSLRRLSRTRSHLSVCELESVQNFDSIISLNSMLSKQNWGSQAWSDFDDPAMLDKLSQIEAEMDECLHVSDSTNPDQSRNFSSRTTITSHSTTHEDSSAPRNRSSNPSSKDMVILEEEEETAFGDDDVFEEDNAKDDENQEKGLVVAEKDTKELVVVEEVEKMNDTVVVETMEEQPVVVVEKREDIMIEKTVEEDNDEEDAYEVSGSPKSIDDDGDDEEEDDEDEDDRGYGESTPMMCKTEFIRGCTPSPPLLSQQIPPVKVTMTSPAVSKHASFSQSSSRSSSHSNDSHRAEFMTIQLKPSGCYLYKVERSPKGSSPKHLHPQGDQYCSSSTFVFSASSQCPSPFLRKNVSQVTMDTDDREHSTEDNLSDAVSQSTISAHTCRKFNPNITAVKNRKSHGYGSGWKTFLRQKKNSKMKLCKVNGHVKTVIPKRTACNERKASKVLGIIFAVFVILWTPFFIINVLTVACQECMQAIKPAMMAAIIWLGYLSSLANPIIYTMFNTSFRRAFYKIVTCQYRSNQQRAHTLKAPEAIHLTTTAGWTGSIDIRRNTPTFR